MLYCVADAAHFFLATWSSASSQRDALYWPEPRGPVRRIGISGGPCDRAARSGRRRGGGMQGGSSGRQRAGSVQILITWSSTTWALTMQRPPKLRPQAPATKTSPLRPAGAGSVDRVGHGLDLIRSGRRRPFGGSQNVKGPVERRFQDSADGTVAGRQARTMKRPRTPAATPAALNAKSCNEAWRPAA